MRLSQFIVTALGLTFAAGVAGASSFSFTGTFTQDDQLELFQFTAPSASVTLRTWGYAGGTNAASIGIAPGGFDPILSLFDATEGLVSSSPFIADNDNGAGVAFDPVTGNGFDALLSLTSLNIGKTYVLVLSQSDNFANSSTYGDGFHEQGMGDFTPGLFGCGAASFCDSTPAARTGNWAVDIVGVGTAQDITNGPVTSAPEPGTSLMFAAGIAGLALVRRRRSTV